LVIVGKETGYTAKHADIAIIVPIIEEKWITPLSEAFQAVIFHSLVEPSHFYKLIKTKILA